MKGKQISIVFVFCLILAACGPSGNDAAQTEPPTGTPRDDYNPPSGNPHSDADLDNINKTNSMGNDTSSESIDTPHSGK